MSLCKMRENSNKILLNISKQLNPVAYHKNHAKKKQNTKQNIKTTLNVRSNNNNINGNFILAKCLSMSSTHTYDYKFNE